MGAVWLILAIYLWMAMYRVYGRSWWLTSLKFLALLMVYSVILSVGMGLVFVMALSEV
jgi:ABC-type xylose transport system permease subunit